MIFINDNVQNMLNFDTISIEDLIDKININGEKLENTNYLIEMMKQLPASLSGFHGTYKGGLFDHVLLVTNIAYVFFNQTKNLKIEEVDILKAAIYHDLGKIDSYTKKGKWKSEFKFRVNDKDLGYARFLAQKDFKVRGKDPHVERCFVIMKNAKLPVNIEIEYAIAFHHGGWAGYYPKRGSPMASILHSSDLMASQLFHI